MMFCFFMQLLNGLQDSNDTIIAATFQALSAIVPILGGEVVIGSPGRKIFFDQTPDVRENPVPLLNFYFSL